MWVNVVFRAGDRLIACRDFVNIRVISNFAKSGGAGSADGLYFHAAMTDLEITRILGATSSWEFGYR